jgi:hypothetical protein
MIIDYPLVIDGRQVAGRALSIVAMLMEALGASVALQDLHRREAHIKMTGTWWCDDTPPEAVPVGMRDPAGEELSVPINGRWRLWVAPDTHFPVGARDVVREAARRLADFLPAQAPS